MKRKIEYKPLFVYKIGGGALLANFVGNIEVIRIYSIPLAIDKIISYNIYLQIFIYTLLDSLIKKVYINIEYSNIIINER